MTLLRMSTVALPHSKDYNTVCNGPWKTFPDLTLTSIYHNSKDCEIPCLVQEFLASILPAFIDMAFNKMPITKNATKISL